MVQDDHSFLFSNGPNENGNLYLLEFLCFPKPIIPF